MLISYGHVMGIDTVLLWVKSKVPTTTTACLEIMDQSFACSGTTLFYSESNS